MVTGEERSVKETVKVRCEAGDTECGVVGGAYADSGAGVVFPGQTGYWGRPEAGTRHA